jgi:hypothetical protein
MNKTYRIEGKVTLRFYTTVTVQHDDDLEDEIEDAMKSGHFQLEGMVDYVADSMEQFSAPKTFEDYINE